ncbi:MAG TPA: CBS domain-containing protein [Kofleriaceae bacterium]|nr:CBS domain-containing protein [Kofleriaceae bacterium]
MCKQVHAVERDTSLRDVARIMKEKDIGDVLVVERGGRLCGIVTDRDLVVRAVAAGRDLESTRAGDICSDQLFTLEPSSMVDQAVGLMREHAVRRVPVVDKGMPVGIVTMGDLARALDPSSALADVSAAPPSA